MSGSRPIRRASADAELRLTLAHALRTPLTAITLGAGALREDALGPLTATQREVVETVAHEVARMQQTLDELLRTEHLGAYAGPRPRYIVDLGALVRTAITPLERQARARNVRIVRRLARGVRVEVEVHHVAWIVASLVGNALRYAPPDTQIDVALRRAVGVARVRVTDQGPGLPPGDSARLFDADAGRGWTLPLVREIAEAHGGDVRVEPVRERGCRFALELPVAPRGVVR